MKLMLARLAAIGSGNVAAGQPRVAADVSRRHSSCKSLHAVAVLAVPFRPENWEVSDLVNSPAHVLWLGDQFDLREEWV